MKIETERQASVTILTPAVRRLDASVAVAFKAAIAQEIGEDSTDLIVDFSKIDFIDSSGLGTLVSLMKMMNGKGEMTLCALNPGIRNMFTLTRMDRIFVFARIALQPLRSSIRDAPVNNVMNFPAQLSSLSTLAAWLAQQMAPLSVGRSGASRSILPSVRRPPISFAMRCMRIGNVFFVSNLSQRKTG